MSREDQMEIEQMNFSRQIKEYAIGIEETIAKLIDISNYCRSVTKNTSPLKQIQLMIGKLELELKKLEQALVKINNKVMSKGGMNSIMNFFTNTYNMLTRESHQLISMCGNQLKLPKESDFKKIKQFEQQLDDDWQGGAQKKRKRSLNYTIGDMNYISSFNQSGYSHQNLTKLATAQIQQEFLAIRLVSYKLYEKYNGHGHQKLHDELQLLKQQQQKLAKEIGQMKEVRMNLLSEERRLQSQLSEVKKINELIGRRYFIENSRIDTNFTSN